jgi:hypothetical protein
MKYRADKICLFLLIGVICMLNSYGCTGGDKYKLYSSKDQELNITIDYISNWVYQEDKDIGSGYASVLFFDSGEDKNFKARISVTARIAAKIESKPKTLEEMVADLTTRRLKFKDAKLLSMNKIKLLGLEAKEILLSYKVMDKLYSVGAKLILAKEKVVVFKKGDKFWVLSYVDTEQGFDKFSKAFDHMVKTLKFKK